MRIDPGEKGGASERMVLFIFRLHTNRECGHKGAEVILTNQTHGRRNAESRWRGFFHSSSSYLLALSNAFVARLGLQTGALDRIHVNRGDGDGRGLHL